MRATKFLDPLIAHGCTCTPGNFGASSASSPSARIYTQHHQEEEQALLHRRDSPLSCSVEWDSPARAAELSCRSRRRRAVAGRAGMEAALIKHQGFCRRCIDVVFILSSLMSTCELDRFVIQAPYIKVRAPAEACASEAEVLLRSAGAESCLLRCSRQD